MDGRSFLDSNILLYLLSADEAKKAKVAELLSHRPLISVQVLNEVTNVCRKKARMPWDEITEFLTDVRHFCAVTGLTERTHDAARRLAERHQLSFYDANIVAAAIDSGATVVWSEDMHHGLVIEKSIAVMNPFRG